MKTFAAEVRRRIGLELALVQVEEKPTDWKPMKIVGAGVRELRISLEGAYRVIYLVEQDGPIHVLHAFQKKDRKTRTSDVDLARRRFQLIKNRQ